MSQNAFQIAKQSPELSVTATLGPSDLANLALPSFFTMLAAPGPKKVIVPRLVIARLEVKTTPYTGGGDVTVGQDGWPATTPAILGAFLQTPDLSADLISVQPVIGFLGDGNYYYEDYNGFVNKPLVLQCVSNFADGDSLLHVTVKYTIELVP